MIEPRKGTVLFGALNIADKILMKGFEFFSKINLHNSINYFGIDEKDNSIFLKVNGSLRLYGIRLETRSNKTMRLANFTSFRQEFKNDIGKDVDLMISIVKDKGVEAIYIFSPNKQIITSISKNLEIKVMNPYEILSAIYHIFLLDVYEIKDKRLLNRYTAEKHTESLDILFRQFPSLISIASDTILQEYTPYQITSLKDKDDFSIIDLFRNKWEGVCHLYIDMSVEKIKNRLSFLYNQSKLGDVKYKKEWEKISEAGESKVLSYLENHCVILNGMFYLKDKAYSSSFQDTLGVVAEERFLITDKLLPRTLLLNRDVDFDIIADERVVGKFFATSLCADCIKTANDDGSTHIIPDFYGLDINGNFFNYMFKNNPSPHGMIFGTTGAGKSVAAIKMVCQMTGYDFEKKIATSISRDRKIRYLNVGYTGGELFDNIKKSSPNMIEIVSSSLNKIRFSLFDFDDLKEPTEEELLIFINFINLMLEVSSNDDNRTLTNDESSKLRKALEILLTNDFPDLSLREIKKAGRGAYDNIVDNLLSQKDKDGNLIYPDGETTHASQLKEPYRSRFYRPTLKDLSNLIYKYSNDINSLEIEREVYARLKNKFDNIVNNPIFSTFSNVDFSQDMPMYYGDFDKIKEDKKNFIAIGWLMISSWYRNDKINALKKINARERRPDSFYFIEEAHNFLGIPTFAALIKTFAKEVRKYGIHLILVTQDVGDVDEEVRDLFSTAAFLFKEDARAQAYNQIKKVNGGADLDEASMEVFNAIKSDPLDENRTIFLKHSNGVNAFTLPKYKDYSTLFKPLDMDLRDELEDKEI